MSTRPALFMGPWTKYSVLHDVFACTGGTGSPSSSGSWYGANIAQFMPVVLPWPYPVKRFWVWNGSGVVGNWDIGLFSSDGAKLTSTGAFAAAGTNAIQFQAANPTYIAPPGQYYIGISTNSGSQPIFIISQNDRMSRISGCLKLTSAHPLPASFGTPASFTDGIFVMAGFTLTESWF